MIIPGHNQKMQSLIDSSSLADTASKTHQSDLISELLFAVERYYDSCRYLGIILTVRSLPVGLSIYNALCEKYDCFDHWNAPGESSAPPLNSYATDFSRRVFSPERCGLIINEPENWLFQWSTNNQKGFWCELSQHYGRSPVIVVAREVDATSTLVQNYFRVIQVVLDTARFWASNHHIR